MKPTEADRHFIRGVIKKASATVPEKLKPGSLAAKVAHVVQQDAGNAFEAGFTKRAREYGLTDDQILTAGQAYLARLSEVAGE